MGIVSPLMRRRLKALLLAGGTLWAVSVTAGSDSAAAAAAALRDALPLRALQWELGGLQADTLSSAAALTLSESPLLLSARPAVAALWAQEEEEPQFEELDRTTARPVEETPTETVSGTDNGVPARTLIPTGPDGYTVCGSTYISNTTDHALSLEALRQPFAAALAAEEAGPQILIVHTHGSEAYTPADSDGIVWSGDHRTTESRYNVVRIGDEMADVFSEAGISVLHDRTLHDYPSYSDAYDRSLSAIENYLIEYPSIRFVLDIHRDAVADANGNQYKVISDTGGDCPAAQLTLVVGSDGSGLSHPHWMENLRLAVAVQQRLLAQNPTLMRPILLRNSRYNQHATTGSLLVEVGAAGNAPEEAILAGRLFAQQFAALLLGNQA